MIVTGFAQGAQVAVVVRSTLIALDDVIDEVRAMKATAKAELTLIAVPSQDAQSDRLPLG